MWRAHHNSPQKWHPSCGELWWPQLTTTPAHNLPQLATSCHISPHLATPCHNSCHILPQAATIRATSYHKLPQLFEYIIQFIRFINRNRALNRINYYFVDCCHIHSRGYVKCEINTGLAVCWRSAVVVEVYHAAITLNLDDGWWLVVNHHLKPVGYQSLGHHVESLEARDGDLGSREGLVVSVLGRDDWRVSWSGTR